MATLAGAAADPGAEQPPLKEVMETITQLITQDTEPDPGGGAKRTTSQAARCA